jgi:hypothetical protein
MGPHSVPIGSVANRMPSTGRFSLIGQVSELLEAISANHSAARSVLDSGHCETDGVAHRSHQATDSHGIFSA